MAVIMRTDAAALLGLLQAKLPDLAPFTSLTSTKYSACTGQTLFCKLSGLSDAPQVLGEASSLQALQAASTATGEASLTPPIRACGETQDGKQFLFTDHVQFGSARSEAVMKQLGKRLAEMHLNGKNDRFGFHVPTHCGATEQDNTFEDKWSTFWTERRIGDLVRRLADADVTRLDKELRQHAWPVLFSKETDAKIKPAILHGDLWSGNYGAAILRTFDARISPSSYYGHNEAELGICHMFGGFSSAFFRGYHDVIPKLQPHYEERQKAYELYHHLNHALMFGGSYKSGATSIMRDLLRWGKSQGARHRADL
ncbi:Predicted kinase [Ceraceosorus bombacis]|uniref:protein-ribulosamine 3-kinase n=1 Tax=Ceraceosorus bombacis TaxID=401625 RepID=A0A0P1BDY0_9BASI|nr:Predicted kinase [Ceraceosorus bombacis]